MEKEEKGKHEGATWSIDPDFPSPGVQMELIESETIESKREQINAWVSK